MIRLKWLKLRAFRSFAEEVRIDFPASGLVLIRGQNESNHDSSGTGKSTLLLAISYALDMCPFPASELQSWYADTDMQVQVGFDTPQGEVVISRGKRNSLKIGDQEPITGAKAVAEGVRKLFGLDSETLQAITYRPQNTSGLFLSLTDGEKKDFLTKILGLDHIEKAVEVSEANAKKLAAALAAEEAAIAPLEAELVTLRAQVFPENQSTAALEQELLDRNREYEEIERGIKDVWVKATEAKNNAEADPGLAKMREMIAVINQQLQATTQANVARYNDYRSRQTELQKKLQEIARHETTKAQYGQQILKLRSDLQHASEGKCPTCFRTWDDAAKKAAETQSAIDNLAAHIQRLDALTYNRSRIEEELKEQFVTDPQILEIQRLQARYEAAYYERETELTQGPMQEASQQVNTLGIRRAGVLSRIQGINSELHLIATSNQKLDQARKLAQSNIDAKERQIQGRKVQAAVYRTDLNAEKDFLALMGRDGFLGVIFDDVLKEIEDEANAHMGRLANVSHVTIQFKSEVVTDKGTVQKKITPVVSVGGVETKLKSGLSGGMYTSVELVVDLAVMSVVQRRTGALPGFLFLDETFVGQGAATMEAAMEVLREYGQEKLVVVIDHNCKFQEMFTQFIDVSFKDGKSGIV